MRQITLSKQLSLGLILSLAFFVGSAQASNISKATHQTAPSWNFWGGNTVYVERTFSLPSSPDNWLGGTGNWSNGADWSAGLPGSSSDVTINTGSDLVTLDTDASINSLTLGGSGGFAASTLMGDGSGHTLAIAGALTVNQSGELLLLGDSLTANTATIVGYMDASNGSTVHISGDVTISNMGLLSTGFLGNSGGDSLTIGGTLTNPSAGTFYVVGAGDVANVGQLVSTGRVVVASGATLNLTDEPQGLTTILDGAIYDIAGAFTANGNSALAHLTDLEGFVTLRNGETVMDTPTGGTLTIGGNGLSGMDVEGGSTFQVNGDVNNSGGFANGLFGIPNSNIVVTGTLTNNPASALQLTGTGNTATLGNLVNNGTVTLDFGATLHVTGSLTNSADIFTSDNNPPGGNSIVVDGTLTNTSSGQLDLIGADTLTAGELTNSGSLFMRPEARMMVGMLSFDPGAALGISISGADNFSTIDVNGRASLGGTLTVYLMNGYTPPVGQTFQVPAVHARRTERHIFRSPQQWRGFRHCLR